MDDIREVNTNKIIYGKTTLLDEKGVRSMKDT